MEKLLLLFSLVFTLMGTASAQPESNPATIMDSMKERIKPQPIGKVKLTHNQADKEIEQRWKSQWQIHELKNDAALSEEEKKRKVKMLTRKKIKSYSFNRCRDQSSQ